MSMAFSERAEFSALKDKVEALTEALIEARADIEALKSRRGRPKKEEQEAA